MKNDFKIRFKNKLEFISKFGEVDLQFGEFGLSFKLGDYKYVDIIQWRANKKWIFTKVDDEYIKNKEILKKELFNKIDDLKKYSMNFNLNELKEDIEKISNIRVNKKFISFEHYDKDFLKTRLLDNYKLSDGLYPETTFKNGYFKYKYIDKNFEELTYKKFLNSVKLKRELSERLGNLIERQLKKYPDRILVSHPGDIHSLGLYKKHLICTDIKLYGLIIRNITNKIIFDKNIGYLFMTLTNNKKHDQKILDILNKSRILSKYDIISKVTTSDYQASIFDT